LVRLICGERWTTTLKVHEAVRCDVSVAVHRTAVVPTGNMAPLAGAQLTLTPVPLAIALP
jgi:hypothetical protein